MSYGIGQLSEGFLLGLATGTTCLATCGPIYAPYLMQAERSWRWSFLAIAEILAGRFFSYLLFGALAGFSGSLAVEQVRIPLAITAYLLFSAFLIISAFRTNRKERCRMVSVWSSFTERPLLLGALTGINVCPPFLIALARAMDMAGPVSGMLFFAAFFIGTTLFLVPISLFGVAGKGALLRRIARFAALLVGVWFIVQALFMLFNLVNDIRAAACDLRPVVNLMDSTVAQVVVSDTSRLSAGMNILLEKRRGSFHLRSDTAALPDGYIFIEHPLAERIGAATRLCAPGRFICILPDLSGDSSVFKARSVAQFLEFHHFRFDKDSGTAYWVPDHTGMQPYEPADQ